MLKLAGNVGPQNRVAEANLELSVRIFSPAGLVEEAVQPFEALFVLTFPKIDQRLLKGPLLCRQLWCA